jgi:hypothetical protein
MRGCRLRNAGSTGYVQQGHRFSRRRLSHHKSIDSITKPVWITMPSYFTPQTGLGNYFSGLPTKLSEVNKKS